MKNRGIEYSSAECTPAVLPEMKELLPPLRAEQLAVLEDDLLKNGCYTPVIVNEELVIIDGHNRQRLCEKHGLPYKISVFSFENLLEAKQWALDTQKSRRNLEKWELGRIALKLKPEIEAKARANQAAAGGDKFSEKPLSAILPKAVSAVDTRKELAETVGLGQRTMGKVMQIDEYAPDVVKKALDNRELSVNQGYQITKKIQNLPDGEREQAAAQAVEYEKAKKELRRQNSEIERERKIADSFCKAFEKAVLLTVNEENIRIWASCTRMTKDELTDTVTEAREIAATFSDIAEMIEQKILCAEGRDDNVAF